MFSPDEFMTQFTKTYGFAPNFIYCNVTGKPIGNVLQEEFESTLTLLDRDLEQAVDDYFLRILASMRPSMKWNKMRVEDMSTMRKTAPVETMSALLNLLFIDDKIAWAVQAQQRIQLFHHIAEIHENICSESDFDAWDEIMLMLLEIDSKLHLKTELAPLTCTELLAIPADDSFLPALASALRAWYKKRVKWHLDRELDAKFFASNPGARMAWLQAKPVSPVAAEKKAKSEEKQKTANLVNSILDMIINENQSTKPEAMKPVIPDTPAKAVPITKMPTFFKIKGA